MIQVSNSTNHLSFNENYFGKFPKIKCFIVSAQFSTLSIYSIKDVSAMKIHDQEYIFTIMLSS